jgi:hypothetical protein
MDPQGRWRIRVLVRIQTSGRLALAVGAATDLVRPCGRRVATAVTADEFVLQPLRPQQREGGLAGTLGIGEDLVSA